MVKDHTKEFFKNMFRKEKVIKADLKQLPFKKLEEQEARELEIPFIKKRSL